MQTSVKIMRSYDYNHFEICLASDEDMTLEEVDKMRKEAARLVDKAVAQYKTAKDFVNFKIGTGSWNVSTLRDTVASIKKHHPESEWTEKQKATVKKLEDLEYQLSRDYDYEDDFEYGEL